MKRQIYMTELEKGRHTLEQTLLPKMYYNEKANMLNSILDKEGRFFIDALIVYLGIFDEKYKSDDIKVYLQRAKSEEMFFDFVVVKQPESDTIGLADTLVFCLEETTGSVKYFTAEKTLGGDRYLFSTDGEARDPHGKLPDDPDREFQKTANIFIREVHSRFSEE